MDLHSSILGFDAYVVQPGESLVIDKLFGENSYDTVLNLNMALMFVYGSLPRPPEVDGVESFVVRLGTLTLISKNLRSGSEYCGVVQELCMDSEDIFRPQNLSRKGESLKFAIDTCCLDLYQADCYSLMHLVSLVCEVGDIGSATFSVADVFYSIHATTMAVRDLRLCLFIKTEADYFESTRHQFQELNNLIQQMEISYKRCCFVLAFLYHVKFRFHISANMRSFPAQCKTWSWLYLHDTDDLANLGFFFDCQVRLQQQNGDYCFISHTIVACSGWFGSILELLYCSLP